ncbi:MAG TPA: lasso peptide biosynthesis B2 protein [Steroidobacteraceae bacterium]|nr:lasso peptide biosynthesis B2 protein [Steroidobacteraceae bacterium]
MARYLLAEHVFVCVDGEQVVFLDLKADRYWALEAAATAGLDSVIRGWPVPAPVAPDRLTDPQQSDSVADATPLIERGLITEIAAGGKDATPVRIEPASGEVSSTGREATRPGSWMKFVAAALRAKCLLRCCSFERVIRGVKARKSSGRATRKPLDLERVRALLAAFSHYRVFLFASKDECLYDSLALLEFLARHDLYPDWVFGVQTRPFAAHCWVQQGGFVFNDTAEHVSGFTPIMVV